MSPDPPGAASPVRSDAIDEPISLPMPLTIKQVAASLRLPAPTIRSWELRYGIAAADRSRGGHRRYGPEHLDALRRMRDLIAAGRRPVDAARLVRAGPAGSPGPLVDAFLQAARDLAPDRITATLEAARLGLGLDRTIDAVVLPAMHQIGHGWVAGRIDISHEHLATNTTTRWLSNLAPLPASRPSSRRSVSRRRAGAGTRSPIILACGPEDQHTIGLEALGALLRHRHLDCRMLGARTPTDSVTRAVEETDAAAVVLVCQLSSGRSAAVQTLQAGGLQRVHLFYAGAAFDTPLTRQHLPGHYLGTNLTKAANTVADRLVHEVLH